MPATTPHHEDFAQQLPIDLIVRVVLIVPTALCGLTALIGPTVRGVTAGRGAGGERSREAVAQ